MKALIVLFPLLLAGCATGLGSSAGKPAMELDVVWHVEQGEPYLDFEGRCHYRAEDRERALRVVWRQVSACVRGDVPVRPAHAAGRGVRHVRIFLARDYFELNRRYVKAYGMASYKAFDKIASAAKLSMGCTNEGGCSYMLGFYFGRDVVLVGGHRSSEESLGHELKHVYDGSFHDGVGRRF